MKYNLGKKLLSERFYLTCKIMDDGCHPDLQLWNDIV